MAKLNIEGTLSLYCLLILLLCSCHSQRVEPKADVASSLKKIQKPASSYTDTLPVLPLSVVFFRPDPVQKTKLAAVMQKRLFEATMHDYSFQEYYAKRFMEEYFKHIRILDVDTARFLLFKGRHRTFLVDLDTCESNGMLVFDGKKAPELIDMTNVATRVSDYFQ